MTSGRVSETARGAGEMNIPSLKVRVSSSKSNQLQLPPMLPAGGGFPHSGRDHSNQLFTWSDTNAIARPRQKPQAKRPEGQ